MDCRTSFRQGIPCVAFLPDAPAFSATKRFNWRRVGAGRRRLASTIVDVDSIEVVQHISGYVRETECVVAVAKRRYDRSNGPYQFRPIIISMDASQPAVSREVRPPLRVQPVGRENASERRERHRRDLKKYARCVASFCDFRLRCFDRSTKPNG